MYGEKAFIHPKTFRIIVLYYPTFNVSQKQVVRSYARRNIMVE